MSYSISLSDFKIPGQIFIREYDLSENIQQNSNIARLVIGTSKKGVFNTITYHPDAQSFHKIYGPIDHSLEKRGSFFHRSAYKCLELGPIYAMNLLPLNNDPNEGPIDTIPYQSLSVDMMENNGDKKFELFSSFYRKKDFWEADIDNFLANVNKPSSPNKNKLFNITNLSKTPYTIFVTKTPVSNVSQFNITAREWFDGNPPSYLDEFSYISDTFVDITVVEGNWTNYPILAIDPVFGAYFTNKGLRKGAIKDFLNHESVRNVGVFTGSIIPSLKDAANTVYSIDTILNNNLNQIGLFIAIDTEKLEELDVLDIEENSNKSNFDLVGSRIAGTKDVIGDKLSNIETPDAINFLSYSFGIKEKYVFNERANYIDDHFESALAILKNKDCLTLEHAHLGKAYGYFFNKIKIKFDSKWSPNIPETEAYNTLKNELKPGVSLIKGRYERLEYNLFTNEDDYNNDKYLTVSQVYETTERDGSTYLNILLSHPDKRSEMNNFRDVIDLSKVSELTADNGISVSNEPDNITKITISKNAFDKIVSEFTKINENYTESVILEKKFNFVLENKNSRLYFYSNEGFKKTTESSGDVYSFTIENKDKVALTAKDIIYNYRIYLNTKQVVRPDWSIDKNGNAKDIKIVLIPDRVYKPSGQNDIHAYLYSKLGIYLENNIIQNGDKISRYNIVGGTDKEYFVKITKNVDKDGIEFYNLRTYDKIEPVYNKKGKVTGFNFTGSNPEMQFHTDKTITIVDSGVNTEGKSRGKYYEDIEIINNTSNSANTVIQIDLLQAEKITVNDYVVSVLPTEESDIFRYRLSRIINKKRKINSQGEWIVEVEVETPAFIKEGNGDGKFYITRVLPIDEYANLYQGFFLDGFKLTDEHLPANPNNRYGRLSQEHQLEKILGMLDPVNSRFSEYISNTDKIDFRYIIDTYSGAGTIKAQMGAKIHLTRLAKARGMCLAFINPPSMKDFSKSNEPMFTDIPTDREPNPEVDTAYIATGGNLDLNPSNIYSLVDEQNGSKYAGGLLPYLIIRENGKNFPIPTAAHFSNLYIQKFLDGKPFDIPAGMNAVLSERNFVGLEYDFTTRDIKNITDFGLNVIQNIPKNGPTVMSNEAMYQRTQSAFNSLHVRDLLITIERAISQFLRRYLFKKNNIATRMEIVNWINSYLSNVKALGGVYAYSVVMDDSNNTPEVIDANMGIVSVIIEPTKATESFLLNVVTTATGKLSTTNFSQIIM